MCDVDIPRPKQVYREKVESQLGFISSGQGVTRFSTRRCTAQHDRGRDRNREKLKDDATVQARSTTRQLYEVSSSGSSTRLGGRSDLLFVFVFVFVFNHTA